MQHIQNVQNDYQAVRNINFWNAQINNRMGKFYIVFTRINLQTRSHNPCFSIRIMRSKKPRRLIAASLFEPNKYSLNPLQDAVVLRTIDRVGGKTFPELGWTKITRRKIFPSSRDRTTFFSFFFADRMPDDCRSFLFFFLFYEQSSKQSENGKRREEEGLGVGKKELARAWDAADYDETQEHAHTFFVVVRG